MKKHFFIFILTLTCFCLRAQNLYLKIEGVTPIETKVIDSISYKKIHENTKSVTDETAAMANSLLKRGYLENELLTRKNLNDTTFIYTFSLGRKMKFIKIHTGKLTKSEKELLAIDKDTITMPLDELEAFMNSHVAMMERKGYSLSSLQLVDYTVTNTVLNAALKLKTENKRTLDDTVLEGYPKFPEGIKKNIAKQYKGKTFNQENLQRVYNDFNALRFVKQKRYPEILFKKDSTKVYVYLEKAKSNTFDGFIGFNNDENSKIAFTGYLDLLLNNVLNTGEKFNLFWKSDGNEQKTFNVGIELPYIFKTPIGIKANLRIFKQDSTFQNTMTDLNIGYYFSYNSKLYIGHQATQSVDIQNLNSSVLSDYSNSFWTGGYEYTAYNPDDFIFPTKTSLLARGGIGNRDAKTGSADQYFVQLNFAHNIYLNKKNIINIRGQSYYLNSNSYIINELYRFGGINSFRGFNENSLQANLYGGLMVEYRYVLAPNLYLNSITDYGYFQDKTANVKNNILGLGVGFGLLTQTGLFKLVYANGSTKNEEIKLSNSIVHLSFTTTF